MEVSERGWGTCREVTSRRDKGTSELPLSYPRLPHGVMVVNRVPFG